MQAQRIASVPILRVSINVIIDTMLKFDTNADVNVDFDAKCKQTLSLRLRHYWQNAKLDANAKCTR